MFLGSCDVLTIIIRRKSAKFSLLASPLFPKGEGATEDGIFNTVVAKSNGPLLKFSKIKQTERYFFIRKYITNPDPSTKYSRRSYVLKMQHGAPYFSLNFRLVNKEGYAIPFSIPFSKPELFEFFFFLYSFS